MNERFILAELKS